MDSVKEGQVLYKLHKIRERDRKIIEAKKSKALKEHGELKCEACGFDFKLKYGKLGEGYIECHHLIPVSYTHLGLVSRVVRVAASAMRSITPCT